MRLLGAASSKGWIQSPAQGRQGACPFLSPPTLLGPAPPHSFPESLCRSRPALPLGLWVMSVCWPISSHNGTSMLYGAFVTVGGTVGVWAGHKVHLNCAVRVFFSRTKLAWTFFCNFMQFQHSPLKECTYLRHGNTCFRERPGSSTWIFCFTHD